MSHAGLTASPQPRVFPNVLHQMGSYMREPDDFCQPLRFGFAFRSYLAIKERRLTELPIYTRVQVAFSTSVCESFSFTCFSTGHLMLESESSSGRYVNMCLVWPPVVLPPVRRRKPRDHTHLNFVCFAPSPSTHSGSTHLNL